MAKINPVKVKQDADKEEKAGRIEKAIELYKQLVADNPRDWNTIKKVGDLYARLNRNKEAAQEYAKVADFYARDGFHLKAIAVWKQIQKLDPAGLETYVHLADLYAKQGLMVEAKNQYAFVVEEYKKRGKIREAGDALGKIVEIDPDDLKAQSMLAEFHVRGGNASKAVEVYVTIAENLNKKGHLAEALQVLERGIKIDPKSGKLRAELARVHLLQKNWDKAVHVLEEAIRQSPNDPEVRLKLGEAYLGAKKIEEAEEVFRRLLQGDPENQDARIQMARVKLFKGRFDEAFDTLLPVVDRFVEKKEGEKAAALLQQIVQRNEGHIKSLVKLVEVYRVLRKDSAVAATYQQLSEAYIREGQMEQAASVLEILVEMDPQNAQHRSKLEFVRGRPGGAPPASSAGYVQSPTGEFFEDLDAEAPTLEADVAPAAPAAARAPAPAAPTVAGAPRIEPSGPLTGEDREFIDEHLAEGRVFRKYGLQEKAADQFLAVVARFPDHQDARLELRDVYKDKGDKEKAAEQCLALAEIYRLKGDAAGAAEHEAAAFAMVPGAAPPAPEPPAPLETLPEEPLALEAPLEEPASEAVEEAEAAAEEDIPLEVEEGVEVEEGGLEAPEEPTQDIGPLDLEEPAGAELSGGFIEEEAEAEGELDLALPAPADELDFEAGAAEPEAPPPPPRAARSPPPRPSAPAKPAPAPRPSRIQPRPAAARPAPPPSLSPRRTAPAPKAAREVPPELQRALDEVEQYVSLGFVDDAKDALGDIVARFPDHPAVAEKAQSLGLAFEAPAEPPKAPRPTAAARPKAPPKPAPAAKPAAPGRSTRPPAPAPEPEPEPDLDLDLGLSSPPEPSADDELSSLIGEAEPPPEDEAEASLPLGAASDDPFGDLGLEESLSSGETADPVGAEEDVAPDQGLSTEEAPGDAGLDLGAELDGLFETQAAVAEPAPEHAATELGDAGLADIFKEFKKGVDKQLGKEDHDTRYNLGIAYKEMGLVDEAIAEFQLAARDPGRYFECTSMLGMCFLDKGMAKLAVKWFEKGLATDGRGEEEYQGLRYDLAVAHELAGETDRALELYTELYGLDANFRDVASKVRELGAALR